MSRDVALRIGLAFKGASEGLGADAGDVGLGANRISTCYMRFKISAPGSRLDNWSPQRLARGGFAWTNGNARPAIGCTIPPLVAHDRSVPVLRSQFQVDLCPVGGDGEDAPFHPQRRFAWRISRSMRCCEGFPLPSAS